MWRRPTSIVTTLVVILINVHMICSKIHNTSPLAFCNSMPIGAHDNISNRKKTVCHGRINSNDGDEEGGDIRGSFDREVYINRSTIIDIRRRQSSIRTVYEVISMLS